MEDGFDSQPLDTGSAVYTGAVHGVDGQRSFTVRAVARGSGEPLWRRDLPTSPTFGVGALLSVANNQVLTVYLGPAGGFAFDTLDPDTGATIATANESALVPPRHGRPRRRRAIRVFTDAR